MRAIPLLFAVVAVVVQAFPAVVVVSRRFEPLAPSRSFRLLLAATYLAIPNSWEVDANLTNAQWHLALVALLCLLAAPGNPAWKLVDVVATILSGLTGPFVIVLAVVGVWWLWKGPRTWWRIGLWGLTVVLALVQGVELLAGPRPPRSWA